MKKRISATDFIIERCIREAEENCGQELDESLGSWFAKKGAEAKQGLKNINADIELLYICLHFARFQLGHIQHTRDES